jgi:hypothetical protein
MDQNARHGLDIRMAEIASICRDQVFVARYALQQVGARALAAPMVRKFEGIQPEPLLFNGQSVERTRDSGGESIGGTQNPFAIVLD